MLFPCLPAPFFTSQRLWKPFWPSCWGAASFPGAHPGLWVLAVSPRGLWGLSNPGPPQRGYSPLSISRPAVAHHGEGLPLPPCSPSGSASCFCPQHHPPGSAQIQPFNAAVPPPRAGGPGATPSGPARGTLSARPAFVARWGPRAYDPPPGSGQVHGQERRGSNAGTCVAWASACCCLRQPGRTPGPCSHPPRRSSQRQRAPCTRCPEPLQGLHPPGAVSPAPPPRGALSPWRIPPRAPPAAMQRSCRAAARTPPSPP